MVDTFGSNAQIPQIYRQFGFQQLFANRFGGDKTEDVFLSEGIDGTRLLVIGKDLASSAPGKQVAFRLCRSWIDTDNLFADGDRLSGGLPRMVNNYIENEEVLSLHYADLTRQRADRPGENWMLSSYHQYVEDLRSHKADYPVVNGDLNPEFTGTFSLRTPLRLRNRVVETQLLEAEKWASLAIPGFDPGTPIFRNAGDFLTAQEDIGGFQIETPNGGEIFASSGTIDPPTISTDAMGQRMTLSGQFPAMKWNKGQNRLKWSLDLQATAGEPALGLRLWLDWFGEGTRIRLNIPTLIDSAQGVYEIPFGVVRRRAYRPRGTAKGEWPAHRFVALEGQKKGLALVNRGVAGVEVSGGTLSSTLIRAYYPGPMAWVPPTVETSQHGQHTYDFLLIPYAGSWKSAGVVRQAQEFNTPARLAEGCRVPGGQISLLTIDRENLVLSSVKTAEDGSGDLLIRFYETFGQETAGTIALPGAESACLSDVTEAPGTAISCANGRIPVSCRPFEIQTIRVKRPLH